MKAKNEEFADAQIGDPIPLNQALVLQRDGDDDHANVRTNVPHLVVHHSPTGFEFGYAGSGPADLALNACQWYLNSIGYKGEKIDCFDGTCWSLAWVLHQEFKRTYVANAPHQGVTIPMIEIKQWFEEHITDEMKRIYAATEEAE